MYDVRGGSRKPQVDFLEAVWRPGTGGGGRAISLSRPESAAVPQARRMQAVAVARTLILVALALFLIGDLTSLALRIAGASSAAAAAAAGEAKELATALPSRRGFPGGDNAVSSGAPVHVEKDEKARFTSAVKNSCLPKLICELNASPEKDKLTPKAKYLLQIIRETSISMTADASSRYHFAAHMGQLISGIDGTGCHNFYPSCPLPSVQVLSLLNKPDLI